MSPMNDYIPPSNLPPLVIWEQWHDVLWAKYASINAAIDAAYVLDPTDAALFIQLKNLELQEKYASMPKDQARYLDSKSEGVDEATPSVVESGEQQQPEHKQKGDDNE